MQEKPTSLRIDDPGVRALFTESARFQSWLDVEAALARAQAELGIIPESAAREITRKAHLSYLDLAAVREGLARTGHPLVPLIWRWIAPARETPAATCTGGRPPRTSRRPASSSRCAGPTTSSCASSRPS